MRSGSAFGLVLGLAASTPLGAQADAGRPFARWFDELTEGLGERPIPVARTEGSNGVLEIDWNGSVLPILVSRAGVFVAAATLGEGRMVDISGRDSLAADA